MGGISVDTSELRAYVVKLESAPAESKGALAQVVSKGALNIKEDMQAELRSSGNRGFQYIASTVNYDLVDGGMTAKIGPDKPSGALANIAYFGSYKGGGTREDPVEALNREAPNFEEYVTKVAGELL